MLAILMDTIALSFTTRYIDESFVSYHLTWHKPLNKTHRVPSFTLKYSNSRPPLAKCIKQQRQKTTKASSSIAMALRCPDFFLSKFPDFGLFFGLLCRFLTLFTFGGNPANVDCVTIGHCPKYRYVDEHLRFCKVSEDGSK